MVMNDSSKRGRINKEVYNLNGAWLVVDDALNTYATSRLKSTAVNELLRLSKEYPDRRFGIVFNENKMGKIERGLYYDKILLKKEEVEFLENKLRKEVEER